MCRFIAYIGKEECLLSQLFSEPSNSLISQSKQAKKSGPQGLNADGFGLAWYTPSINNEPALFKSIAPAWSDQNLDFLVKKTTSACFLGHIRAATIGDVTLQNCHPFAYDQYSFVHNGTIKHFDLIRRDLLELLDDDIFKLIKGNTDSEHLFALIMQLKKSNQTDLTNATRMAVKTIANLQQNHGHQCLARINTALTDGKSLVITRYISDLEEAPISLFYSQTIVPGGTIVASEPLTDTAAGWQEVELNTALTIHPDQSIQVTKLLT